MSSIGGIGGVARPGLLSALALVLIVAAASVQAWDGFIVLLGGMLILSQSKSGFSARKLAYPDERRISAIKARAGAKFMVANYGKAAPYDALLRVDPAAQSLSANDVLPVPLSETVGKTRSVDMHLYHEVAEVFFG